VSLSTLANNTVITVDLISSLVEDMYVISVDLAWSVRGLTAGETPLQVGLSHGDYTVGEVLENLDASSLDPDDKIDQEHARRLVRRVGVFQGTGETDLVLADGKEIRTPVKFTVGDGKSFDAWLCNRSGALLTTGAVLQIFGTVYGRWLR